MAASVPVKSTDRIGLARCDRQRCAERYEAGIVGERAVRQHGIRSEQRSARIPHPDRVGSVERCPGRAIPHAECGDEKRGVDRKRVAGGEGSTNESVGISSAEREGNRICLRCRGPQTRRYGERKERQLSDDPCRSFLIIRPSMPIHNIEQR